MLGSASPISRINKKKLEPIITRPDISTKKPKSPSEKAETKNKIHEPISPHEPTFSASSSRLKSPKQKIKRSYGKYILDLSNYEIIEQIQNGVIGSTNIIRCRKTNKSFTSKTSLYESNPQNNTLILHDIGLLIRIQQPTIIKIQGFSYENFEKRNNLTILKEYFSRTSLSNLIEKTNLSQFISDYSNTKRQIILVGITRGMMILHKNRIIHGDLKPENILLDKNYYPKITDYGLTKIFNSSSDMLSNLNTVAYLAPEVLQDSPISQKSDVYSFGILMYEVLSNSRAYKDIFSSEDFDLSDFKEKIINGQRPEFTFPIKDNLKQMIESCWSSDPSDRPTFSELFCKLSLTDEDNFIEFEDNCYRPIIDCDDRMNFCLEDVNSDELFAYVEDVTEDAQLQSKNDEIERLIMSHKEATKAFNEQKSQVSYLTKYILQLKEDNAKLRSDNRHLTAQNTSLTDKNDFLKREISQMAPQMLDGREVTSMETYDKFISALSSFLGGDEERDPERAHQLLQEASQGNNSTASFMLGLLYEHGINARKDLSLATEYYTKAAEQGNSYGFYRLGYCFHHGIDFPEDIDQAVAYYKKAADLNNVDAIATLADFDEKGIHVDQDVQKQLEFAQKAAERGDVFSLYRLGLFYEEGSVVEKDDEKAFNYYRMASEGGNVDALCKVADFYNEGKGGVERDTLKALELYEKAASLGNTKASFAAGVHYDEVEPDYEKALKYYEFCNERKYAPVYFYLARMYEEGRGVPIDLPKAVDLYQKAAEKNDSRAQFALARMLEEGRGLKRDIPKAIDFYQTAAVNGYSEAYYRLGLLYEKGNDVIEPDYKTAIDYYTKAAALGNPHALCSLGSIYYHGVGVLENIERSIEFFTKAAQLGDTRAMNTLANLYENGTNVKTDIPKARHYYEMSAERGDPDGYVGLGGLYVGFKDGCPDVEKAEECFMKAADMGSVKACLELGELYEKNPQRKNVEKAREWYQKAEEK